MMKMMPTQCLSLLPKDGWLEDSSPLEIEEGFGRALEPPLPPFWPACLLAGRLSSRDQPLLSLSFVESAAKRKAKAIEV